ncbi:uncharacterized protein LOC115984606 [Quercus lobata]|uniref:uncharacterized protein LOC115984606 n=1 Tax=Quercus lobata TaxID=97700 RepID=UPI0012476A37|nr:uncharacterized protein LOC115984606 [Quercus lobata]
MQGIGVEGEADWRSSNVGAAVGVFEVPTDMPCYEVATTASGGRSLCQSMEGAEEHDRACDTCASCVSCVTVEYTGTPSCLGALQRCPRVVAPILHCRPTNMEGRCAIDLFLDSRGSSSRTCLSSIRDEASATGYCRYIRSSPQNLPPR